VAEWGISDFVVILTETSTEAAKDLMQEALDALPATLSGADVSAVLAGPPHPEDLRSAVLRVDRGFLHSPRPSGGRIRILREGAEEGGDAPRILMVEDEMTTSTLVQHRLSREGMEVVHETDGGDALHRIQDEAAPPGFDLVLLDVNLPGAGGFQLLQAIRDRPGWRELPVVMLTGLGREADIVRAFEAGADDYMVKPFSPTELLARVQRLLRRPR